MKQLILQEDPYRRILAQCLAERPNEACGLVFGHGEVGGQVAPMRNAAASATFFAFDPLEQMKVMQRHESEGSELVAIYHSHLTSPPRPSATDIELAVWEDCAYLIISLQDDGPVGRAFLVREGTVTEIPLVVDEGEVCP